jgi:hypothetical protein
VENKPNVDGAMELAIALLEDKSSCDIKLSAGGKEIREHRAEILARIKAGDKSDQIYLEAMEFVRDTSVGDMQAKIAAFVDKKIRKLLVDNANSLTIASGRLNISVIEGPSGRPELSVSFPGTV